MVAVAALKADRAGMARMKKRRGLAMLGRMNRRLERLLPIAVCLLLAACGSLPNSVVVEPVARDGATQGQVYPVPVRTPIAGGSYVVVKGDTLYSIAFRKGVDFRDLARWNSIPAPYTIWPGQRLTLTASTAAQARIAASSPAAKPSSAPVFEPVTAAPAAATPINASSHAAAALAAKPQHPVAAAAAEVVPVAGLPVSRPMASEPALKAVPGGPSRAVSGVSWRWPVEGSLISRFNSTDAIPGIEIAGKSGDPVRAAADGVVVYSGNGLVGYGELVIIKHSDSFLSAYGHNRKRLVKEGQHVSAGQQIAEMGSTGATRDELEFQIRKDGNPVDPLSYLPAR